MPETRSSHSQKRSEPATMRGQARDEHGGPPWIKEESSPAGWRKLLRAWGDEGDGSLSHREAVSFK